MKYSIMLLYYCILALHYFVHVFVEFSALFQSACCWYLTFALCVFLYRAEKTEVLSDDLIQVNMTFLFNKCIYNNVHVHQLSDERNVSSFTELKKNNSLGFNIQTVDRSMRCSVSSESQKCSVQWQYNGLTSQISDIYCLLLNLSC